MNDDMRYAVMNEDMRYAAWRQARSGLKRQARRAFSRIGFAYFAMLAVMLCVQMLMLLPQIAMPEDEFFNSWIYEKLLENVPLYLVAFPVTYLIIARMPRVRPVRGRLGIGGFFVILLVAQFFMQAGGLISNAIAAALEAIAGKSSQDLLYSAVENMSVLEAVVELCIIAPITEELFFRRLIIDRTARYGEGVAIIISALVFSLFHSNLYQLVYAFLLGALFGYVYLRYGSLWHTILLHAAVNFIGGVIPIALDRMGGSLPELDLPAEGTRQMAAAEAAMSLPDILYIVHTAALYAMMIAGIVIFIRNLRRVRLQPREMQLMRGENSAAVANPGMIIYIVATLVMTAYMFVVMMQ